jgi:hypothetical protein
MANAQNIVAGIAAGGTSGGDLAWFAPALTAGPVAASYTAEVQTVTITGTPTGGTFTLFWRGLSGGSQIYNVATTALQTALNTAWAPFLNGGTVVVAGTAGTSYTLTFPISLGNVPAATVLTAFTGGTAPAAAVTETTPGAGSNPATGIIPASFKSAGWCDASGVTVKVSDSSKDITPFGSLVPVRTILSQSKKTFDVTFDETNHTTLEVYHRLPIGATGTAGADGYISNVVDGPPTVQSYAAIFDSIDGVNHIRAYAPNVQATAIGDMQIQMGDAVSYPVTFTAYPDANGNAIYWYIAVGALAGL